MIANARIGFVAIAVLFSSLRSEAAVPLVLGTTYAGAIAVPGQTNAYTFVGTAGQRLFLDSLDSDLLHINVSLLSPGGVLLYQGNDDYDAGPFVLTEPGSYTLVFSALGSTTGNYEFRLLDLSAATPLVLGTVLSDQLSPPLACNIYKFTGTRGQRINLQSISYSTNLAQWQLVSPANFVVASGQIYQNLGTNTLPIDGEYCLMVMGASPSSTPLTFQLLASDVSDGPATASGFGTVHSGTVSANQTNSFTYTAPAGLPVYYDRMDASGQSLVVDLFDPSGAVVFSTGEVTDSGPYVLLRSGTYTLNVWGPGGTSGNFNFRLLDMTASPVLPMNTVVSNVLSSPYQTDIYQFVGTPGQRIYYDSLLPAGGNVQFWIFGPNGQQILAGNTFSDYGPMVLPYGGTYYVSQESFLAANASYAFEMFDVATQPMLPLNTDFTGTLAPYTSLLYQLPGTNGEQLYFNGKGVSAGGAIWTLYDPHNLVLNYASASLGGDFPVTLPYTGNYVLLIANSSATVTFSNQVNTFTLVTNVLTLGATVTNNIDAPGDQLFYTFSGTAGQRLYFDSLLPTYANNINVTLWSPTGVQLVSQNATYDFGPITLPETGGYLLQFSGVVDTTGGISFRLLDPAAQPVLPLNTDIIGSVAPFTSQLLQLAGTNGEQLYFNSKAVTGGGATWTLYAPDNSAPGSASLSGDFELTLAGTGNYWLVIAAGANAVTYSNQVNTFSYVTNALALNTTITNNIAVPGDQLFYTFNGTAGQRLYLDSLLPGYLNVTVTLISPTGIQVVSVNASYDFGPVTLPESGVYLLQFAGSGHTTGGINFQLLDIAAQPVLPLNTDLTGSLTANTTLLYQLPGTPGELLYFYSKGVVGSGAIWTLYGPNNAQVNAASLPQDFSQILPNAGTYVLALQGGLNTVTYSNQVNTFSFITNALTLGGLQVAPIVHPGDQFFYTFNGTAGQRLYFDSRVTNYINVQVTILSPAGTTVFTGNASYDASYPFTLTQTGLYTLVLSGYGHTIGPVLFNLLDLAAATPVTFGSAVSDSLVDHTETRLYRFAGTAGQRVNLQSLGLSGSQATWELLGLTDQPLGSTAEISQNIGVVTLPAAGTYTVAVIGANYSTSPVPYQWSASDVSDSPVTANGFGIVHSGNIAANQTNSFTFAAQAGLPVFFDSQDTSGVSLVVDLMSPDGTTVFSVSETSDAGPVVLPRSGTYTLNVRGPNGTSGNYSFRLLDLSASPTLALNTPVADVLNNPYETDVYQFTSTAGQVLIYNALTNDANYPSIFVQMLNPAWQYVGPGNDFQINKNPFVVQYAGTCYFFVRNLKSQPGSCNFQLLDLSSQAVLPLNVSVTNTLNVYPMMVYRHSGAAGEQLYFHSQPGNPSGAWTLFDPNTQVVSTGSASLTGDFAVTLPYAGTYCLLLQNQGSTPGTEVFEASGFSYFTNSYTIGTPLVGAIAQPGEQHFYTFTGTLGQRLYYNALTNDPPSPNYIYISLFNPQGGLEISLPGSRFSINRGPFTLEQSGTFTLMVYGYGATTGTFAFQLLDLAAQPALPINSSVTNTLDVFPVQLYQYSGTAGQQLYFRGQATNPSGFWTIFDPHNVQGYSPGLVNDFELTLPITGTYAVLLQSYSTTPASETFQVNDYSYFTNSYTIGTPVLDAINRPGERHFYTFKGTIGQRLIYNALTNDPPYPNSIYVGLLNPEGAFETIYGSRFSYNQGPFALQQSGTYTLVIDGNVASVGTFGFQLLDVASQPVLPVNVSVTNSLRAFPLEVYQYTGTAGQHLYFKGSPGNSSGAWNLYDPNNTSVSGAGLINDFAVTLPYTGTYALVIGNQSGAAGTEVFAVNPFNFGENPVVNQAPVLAHITNQVVGIGSTASFTAQATDPDGDSLTFSLDPGGPPGAVINAVTGAFSWDPPNTGLSSVTPVTVRVTDNGIPALSAAQTLTIEVIAGPTMITVQRAGSIATAYWHSAPTKHYQLQYKNELSDPTWQPVGSAVTATDVVTSQPDPTIGALDHRFYRVQALDPFP